jgi:hypothetical protein
MRLPRTYAQTALTRSWVTYGIHDDKIVYDEVPSSEHKKSMLHVFYVKIKQLPSRTRTYTTGFVMDVQGRKTNRKDAECHAHLKKN